MNIRTFVVCDIVNAHFLRPFSVITEITTKSPQKLYNGSFFGPFFTQKSFFFPLKSFWPQVQDSIQDSIYASTDYVPEVQHMVHGEHMSHIRLIYVHDKEACVTFLSWYSGKGGVGKSTVAVQLALAHQQAGKKVNSIQLGKSLKKTVFLRSGWP